MARAARFETYRTFLLARKKEIGRRGIRYLDKLDTVEAAEEKERQEIER